MANAAAAQPTDAPIANAAEVIRAVIGLDPAN
jgi:hypothetical protein